MAYAEPADLVTYSLTASSLTSISTEKKEAALEAASRIADGYLNARYRLPLTAYGSDLKKAICDIASLMLMRGRGFNPEMADAGLLVSGHKDAIKWLEGIAAGKVSPIGFADSSTGGVNTEDLPDAQRGPQIVQRHEGRVEEDDFWGSSSASFGGIGPPKTRGW